MTSARSHKVVIVCDAPSERWLRTYKNGTPLSWTYLGTDFVRFNNVAKMVSADSQLIVAGDIINEIAEDIFPEVVNVDKHFAVDVADIKWLTTDLAERSPGISHLFFNCCAYLAFDRILASIQNDLLVFVEDWFLGRLIRRRATALGHPTSQLTPHSFMDWLPDRLHFTLRRLYRLARGTLARGKFMKEFFAGKRILNQYPNPALSGKDVSNGRPDVFLVTWAEPGTFPRGTRKLTDKYYGELPKLLSEAGYHVGYIVNPYPLTLKDYVPVARSSGDTVVIPEETWGVKEVIRTVFTSLFGSWPMKSRFVVRGVDLTEILRNEIELERAKLRQCQAINYSYIGRFLSKNGFKPKVLIHLFENQPWEKALRWGMKRYLPETRIVGYVHGIFPRLWLGVYPSDRDIEAGQLPDVLVTGGRTWKRQFSKMGYPEERLRVGPAFRFDYLIDKIRKVTTSERTGASERIVLVAGSYSYSETAELLCKVIPVLQTIPDIVVQLKFHPTCMGDEAGVTVMQYVLDSLRMTRLPENFFVTKDPIPKLLDSVDLVIENGTAVAVEAASYGIPVLHVRSSISLDMDELSIFPRACYSAGTPAEIHQMVLESLNSDSQSMRPGLSLMPDRIHELFCVSSDGVVESFVG